MCGIVAMFGEVDRAVLVEMTRRLHHRGPDGMGVEIDGRGGLGHTRLSLLDLAGGAQPLRSPRARRLLAYNGELYNHDDLRRELAGRGAAFSTRCDTEVVLAAFDEWGEACVERFDGMYAFAVLEPERLVVARDPFGIKPLFWTMSADRRRVMFASEVAALLTAADVPATLDRTAILEAAVLGYPLGERTLFAAIARVAPGTVLEVRAEAGGELRTAVLRRARPVAVPPLEAPEAAAEPPSEALVARCEDYLAEQVRLQCIADHPVGVLLSGGLDSSIVATLAARHTRQLCTFNLGTQADDEVAIAAEVARALGSEHDARLVELDECLRRLPATIASLAWPTSFSLVESATARMRQRVKAVLCGDGADELFGGYLAHGAPGAWLDFVRKRFARATAVAWGADRAGLDALFGELAEPPSAALRNRVYRLYLDNQLSISHLERWDHLSMADGLEVRVPFLCRDLARLPAELRWPSLIDPTGGKRILKEVALRVLPEPVRELVVRRRKRPFWAATGGLYAQLQAFVRAIMPDDLRQAHPFRQSFDSPEAQLFFDVFALIFVGHRGVVPAGFEVRDLYHDRWGLRDILARAAA